MEEARRLRGGEGGEGILLENQEKEGVSVRWVRLLLLDSGCDAQILRRFTGLRGDGQILSVRLDLAERPVALHHGLVQRRAARRKSCQIRRVPVDRCERDDEGRAYDLKLDEGAGCGRSGIGRKGMRGKVDSLLRQEDGVEEVGWELGDGLKGYCWLRRRSLVEGSRRSRRDQRLGAVISGVIRCELGVGDRGRRPEEVLFGQGRAGEGDQGRLAVTPMRADHRRPGAPPLTDGYLRSGDDLWAGHDRGPLLDVVPEQRRVGNRHEGEVVIARLAGEADVQEELAALGRRDGRKGRRPSVEGGVGHAAGLSCRAYCEVVEGEVANGV